MEYICILLLVIWERYICTALLLCYREASQTACDKLYIRNIICGSMESIFISHP
jgi:hypothetical protein